MYSKLHELCVNFDANLWKFQYTENANIGQFILFYRYQITTKQRQDQIR